MVRTQGMRLCFSFIVPAIRAYGKAGWRRLGVGAITGYNNGMHGGAGESRTPDTQFRKLLLYPSELQPRDQCSEFNRIALAGPNLRFRAGAFPSSRVEVRFEMTQEYSFTKCA